MSEFVTLAGLFFTAILGGFITVRMQIKERKDYFSLLNKTVMAFGYSFIILGFISISRLFLLRTSQFYMWTDYKLLFFDVVSIICGIILSPELLRKSAVQGNEGMMNYMIFLICAVGMSVITFIWQYWIYRNVNSAIYHMLLPEKYSVLLFTVFIIYEVLNFIASKCNKKEGKIRKNKENKKKNRISLLISFSFVFTVWGYPTFETFMTNISEFTFSKESVIIYFISFLLIIFGVICYITKKLEGRMWNRGILLIFTLNITAYFQQMFLNGALFLMDGEEIRIELAQIIVNCLIWLGMFVVIFAIKKIIKKEWLTIIEFLSVTIVLMQFVGGVSVLISKLNTDVKNDMSDYFSTDGLYEVASEDNVIIFVLDKYDEAYMEQVLEVEPDFLQPLQGFSYFPDTVSQFSRTYPSITYMLTNNTFFDAPSDSNYYDWAFDNCSFWKQLDEKEYATYFYEETPRFIGKSVRKQASNYVEQGTCIKEKISLSGCFQSIQMISLFRTMPYIMKDYFNYTAEEINSLVIAEREWKETPYIVDDAKIKDNIDRLGLTIGNDKKAFRFIHMFGAHPPYTLNKNGERVKGSSDLYLEQYMGSFRIVFDYLDKLREIGKYDDSTIIITADHGENFENGEILPENVNIILFIKPKGAGMGQLEYSSAYASQNDLIPTMEALLRMKSDSKEGIDLFSNQAANKNRIRYHYFHVVDKTIQKSTRTYEIKGNSLDFDNWIATDEYHDFR